MKNLKNWLTRNGYNFELQNGTNGKEVVFIQTDIYNDGDSVARLQRYLKRYKFSFDFRANYTYIMATKEDEKINNLIYIEEVGNMKTLKEENKSNKVEKVNKKEVQKVASKIIENRGIYNTTKVKAEGNDIYILSNNKYIFYTSMNNATEVEQVFNSIKSHGAIEVENNTIKEEFKTVDSIEDIKDIQENQMYILSWYDAALEKECKSSYKGKYINNIVSDFLNDKDIKDIKIVNMYNHFNKETEDPQIEKWNNKLDTDKKIEKQLDILKGIIARRKKESNGLDLVSCNGYIISKILQLQGQVVQYTRPKYNKCYYSIKNSTEKEISIIFKNSNNEKEYYTIYTEYEKSSVS